MTDKPGFTVEEIAATYAAGAHLTAVKMLRFETGCSLLDAVNVLRDGKVAEMPTFKTLLARRKAERYGPQLLAALKDLINAVKAGDGEVYPSDQVNAETLIAEIEKE